jgi:hypothetical protein
MIYINNTTIETVQFPKHFAYESSELILELKNTLDKTVFNIAVSNISTNSRIYEFNLKDKMPEEMKVGTYEYQLKDIEGQIYEIGVVQYGEYINEPTSYNKSNVRKQYTK